MFTYILKNIIDLNVMQCSLFTTTLYMFPLSKRKNFPVRFILSVLFCLLLNPAIMLIQHQLIGVYWASSLKKDIFFFIHESINTVSILLLFIFCLTLCFYVCCRIKFLQSVYFATCSYLTQDLAYTIFVLLYPKAAHRGGQPLQLHTLWIEILISLLINMFFYFTLIKKIFSHIDDSFNYVTSLAYVFFVIGVGRIIGTFSKMSLQPHSMKMFQYLLLYDILLTISLLISQILIYREGNYRRQLAMETQLNQQQYQQFKLFRNSTEDIRHKYHDLKHIIGVLRISNNSEENQHLLDNLENSIQYYDSTMNTGNQTLDALLNEVSYRCLQNQIEWTCLADGTALAHMNAFDLYVMLGNALDNAIEHTINSDLIEKQFISVNIRKNQQLAFITISNYCNKQPNFVNGIPCTTKSHKKEHGYGMKSIGSIVEKYNGQFHVTVEHDIFSLDIMLPLPF